MDLAPGGHPKSMPIGVWGHSTSPPSGNQVDGLPLALVGFGPVERANVKFTKKCILLMMLLSKSRLRIIEK